jgi:hypothetical protein
MGRRRVVAAAQAARDVRVLSDGAVANALVERCE